VDEDASEPEDPHAEFVARGSTLAAAGQRVPSPCVSICRIDLESGMCEGCFRTLKEIADWSHSGPRAQRRLWPVLLGRMAAERERKARARSTPEG
jgi:predicted Fe-S protein YdhL (DUF1289 family)